MVSFDMVYVGVGISYFIKIFLDLLMGTVDCSTLEQSVVHIYTSKSEEKKTNLLHC